MEPKLRSIAIYLPQFHPIAENDRWWGRGFTEWTNVTKAKPLFRGHYQPRLPADLGFYDLRVPEVREEQAALAREYGIYGFCYYHYWFNGDRLLERPFNEVWQSGKPDFPFMLCWANENWTRRWDGGDDVVLKKQEYTADDAYTHIRSLLPIFKDKRYIRVENKPVFAFYRTDIIPNIEVYLRIFRNQAAAEGMELYLCRFETGGVYGPAAMKVGFDAAVEFQPFSPIMHRYTTEVVGRRNERRFVERGINALARKAGFGGYYQKQLQKMYSCWDYNEYVAYLLEGYQYPAGYKRFPGVAPSWDNTARRGRRALLFKNANPTKYEEWLRFHTQSFVPPSAEENFIFINAWNEWAEGAHLEPCQKWGRQYLEATRRALTIQR